YSIERSFLFTINTIAMRLEKYKIQEHNEALLADHKKKFEFIAGSINNQEGVLKKLVDFQVAIPSWALGTGGTRFGRFSGAGEPGISKRKWKMSDCCMH